MHPRTEAFMDSLVRQLAEQGVGDYVIAIRDPDAQDDVVRYAGSVWWRAGLGGALIADAEADPPEPIFAKGKEDED